MVGQEKVEEETTAEGREVAVRAGVRAEGPTVAVRWAAERVERVDS